MIFGGFAFRGHDRECPALPLDDELVEVVSVASSGLRAVIEGEDVGAGDLADLGVEGLVQAGWAEPGEQGEQLVGAGGVDCLFIRDLRTPFGAVGDSGVGREGGNFSREFFTEPGVVVMQIDR